MEEFMIKTLKNLFVKRKEEVRQKAQEFYNRFVKKQNEDDDGLKTYPPIKNFKSTIFSIRASKPS
jgi:hypothetical protein